jgi:hypothetical protein
VGPEFFENETTHATQDDCDLTKQLNTKLVNSIIEQVQDREQSYK